MGKNTKQTKQKSSADESLLAEVAKLRADNFLLSSPAGLTTVGPLPSPSGGNAAPTNTPVITTAAPVNITPVATAPVQPMNYSSSTYQSENMHDTKSMNRDRIEKIEAENEAEIARVDNLNSLLPAEMKRLNDDFAARPKSGGYDSAGVAQMYELSPAMPLPVMPRLKEVPNEITGSFGSGYTNHDRQSGGGGGAIKRKAPTISSVDWKTGKITPMSPSEVSMDTDGIVQAAMESRNPAFAVKAIADNFGNTPLPKGTMVKIPNIQYDKKTNRYVDAGEVTVDMGGNTYADNMNRIFTAHMAKYMINDINKNPKMLKNFGTQGGSQLKFNPSVFVAGQGGVYNSTISKSLMDALNTAGIPSGTTQPIAGSMTARIVGDGKSKANETWLNAKDNNMLADTINGWGNSTANALMGYLLGVR